MRVFELHRKQILGESAWPVKAFHARIDIEVEFDGDVPSKAERRFTMEALRRVLQEADADELVLLSSALHKTAPTPEARDSENGKWNKPDELDLRIVKSAHRVVTEVAKRGASGRAVLASELVGSIGLSAPTIGRLLRGGEAAHDYLAQYVRVAPQGRTKALDLTPEGRMLASKIRAGVVPS